MHCTGVAIDIDSIGTIDSTGSCVRRLRVMLFTAGPKVVDVTFETGGASIHRVFHPTYRTEYKNGSDCAATCTRAIEYIL